METNNLIKITVRPLTKEFITSVKNVKSILAPSSEKTFFALASEKRVNVNNLDFDIIRYPKYDNGIGQRTISTGVMPPEFFEGKEDILVKKLNKYFAEDIDGHRVFEYVVDSK